MIPCDDKEKDDEWTYTLDQQLRHTKTGFCLDFDKVDTKNYIHAVKCNSDLESQRIEFKH